MGNGLDGTAEYLQVCKCWTKKENLMSTLQASEDYFGNAIILLTK